MDLRYLSGFAGFQESEAVPGALPVGRNSPQQPPLGLYPEKLSASAFTAPRAENRRSWLYRIRPSVLHGAFRRISHGGLRTAPGAGAATPPDQLRWDPLPIPAQAGDFLDGLVTVALNGNARMQTGIAIHQYRADQDMTRRYFFCADGELLLVPQQGQLVLHTEFGILAVPPGHVACIPRGVKFRVMLPDGPSRGWVLENYGAMLRLPERGPIGTDGLANDRDFGAPVAAFEDLESRCELLCKFQGQLFAASMDHSPLDVVAWHGNLAPWRYDLHRFNTIGSISYDHPDPSIFTVLTSASDTPGTANVDFVIFPPRWLVMEDTFRPPWYHRNVMSEYMGLVQGEYDAKPGAGFAPGGSSLHNCMMPHGPDTQAFTRASAAELTPQHLGNTMAFMFESRYVIEPTEWALAQPELQQDYRDCWQGLDRHFPR